VPLRQFNYSTITDVLLHIKYTAREDAGLFKHSAVDRLRDYLAEDDMSPSVKLIDVKRELPAEWHRFLNPTNPASGNVLTVDLTRNLFRVIDADKRIKINSISLLARCTDPGSYNVVLSALPAPPPPGSNVMVLAPLAKYGGMHFNRREVETLGIELLPTGPSVKWTMQITRSGGANLQPDPGSNEMEVKEFLIVLGYEWN
jgi:hypothetical protein